MNIQARSSANRYNYKGANSFKTKVIENRFVVVKNMYLKSRFEQHFKTPSLAFMFKKYFWSLSFDWVNNVIIDIIAADVNILTFVLRHVPIMTSSISRSNEKSFLKQKRRNKYNSFK